MFISILHNSKTDTNTFLGHSSTKFEIEQFFRFFIKQLVVLANFHQPSQQTHPCNERQHIRCCNTRLPTLRFGSPNLHILYIFFWFCGCCCCVLNNFQSILFNANLTIKACDTQCPFLSHFKAN